MILKMWSPNTVTYNAHASVSVKAYQTVEIRRANDRDQRAPTKYVTNSLSHRQFHFTNTNCTFSFFLFFTCMENNKMSSSDYRIRSLAEFYKLLKSKFYLLFKIRLELRSNSSSITQHAMAVFGSSDWAGVFQSWWEKWIEKVIAFKFQKWGFGICHLCK